MHVLIIEDDTFFQKFYASKLKEKGCIVDIASDGEIGIKLMHNKMPDVVLLDLIMPKKNGFQVLEQVSKDKKLQKVPILVFSTLGQEKDVKKAKDLGAVDYINKSFFNFESLMAKITEVSKKTQTIK